MMNRRCYTLYYVQSMFDVVQCICMLIIWPGYTGHGRPSNHGLQGVYSFHSCKARVIKALKTSITEGPRH